jgi:hypothetical protein
LKMPSVLCLKDLFTLCKYCKYYEVLLNSLDIKIWSRYK